ncbi:MAG: LTA synthase family protein [Bdellovibrionales bacterium]
MKRFLVLLGAYSICRLLFLCWNWGVYAAIPTGEWLQAFFYGLRFDASAILYTNAILFLLWMLPARVWRWRWLRITDLALFTIINLVFLGLNFIDAEFVKFIGKRTSYDLLFISADVERQSLSILWTYWYFCVGLLGLMGVVLWMLPRFPSPSPSRESWWAGALWRFVALVLIVTGMRGGYQFKPLHPMHAYFSTRHELGLLTLNTPFNLLKSRPRMDVERTRYFADDREPISRLHELTALSRPPLGVAKDFNVVVIIVESLASEYTGVANGGDGYTPFLDSLAQESFYFKYNFANARRSIEGLPAVLCGLPAMMGEPIITSDFSNNRFDCLPRVLSRRGYKSHFLHGAHNGSMHFDTFSKIAGFENFVGLDEYPKTNPADLDEYWGVLDEPMLQYAAGILDRARSPTLLSVFTLSSHHPYYIPPQHRGRFPKGTLEIHESIGYADYALRKFFETARTRPWFNKTIFVITGDHTQKTERPEYSSLIGGWRVPLLIYAPGVQRRLEVSPERITQHIDIMPSVLDLLGISERDRLLVGQSVFDASKTGMAYNYTSVSYWYIDPDVYLEFGRPPHPVRAFDHKRTFDLKETNLERPEVQRAIVNIKSVAHYINEGLLRNNLHAWRESW